jgi:uncharacterized protein
MTERSSIRVAAAGDVHAWDGNRDALVEAFAAVDADADLVLLAGDLTAHGDPDQAGVLADACRPVGIPVVAVLGNHDLHENRGDEVVARLEAGGIIVLDRSATVVDIEGVEVGIAGTKGFVGGFPGSQLPDFGEPLLRRVYRETTEEVDALERALQSIAHCGLRVVLLHYTPTADTLEGEPLGIWTFLGSDRLAIPIAEYQPDVVLHGHAHAGSFEGTIGETPVYNVAVHVTRKEFYVFDLEVTPGRSAIEVDAPPAQ